MTGKSSYRVLPRETMYMENDLLPTNASNFQIRSNFTKEVVLVKEKKRFIHLFSPTVPSSYLTPKHNFNLNSRKTLRSTVSKKFLF